MSDFKNELLFTTYGINYSLIDPIYRKGSLIIREYEVSKEKLEKYEELKKENKLVKPPRQKITYKITHDDLINDEFWNQFLP